MSTKQLIIAGCLLLAVTFAFMNRQSSETGITTIGILQTATHPALDQAREGFIEEMNRLYEGKVRFIVQNAEGSLSQAQSIAESFHAQKKIAAVYAIATPALQAIARIEKNKPIFIAAVSYPESLGVLFSDTNISGISGRVNTNSQAEMIKTLFPQARNIAILYSPGEHNSVMMVKEMEKSLKVQGLTPVLFGVNSESEIPQTITLAARKGDIILLPTDNLLASAIALVTNVALQKKIPVITSDITLVEKGAFAAQGINYFESGKQAAKQARRVLSSEESPGDVGIIEPTDSEVYVNADLLKSFGVEIPIEMGSNIKLIRGGKNAP